MGAPALEQRNLGAGRRALGSRLNWRPPCNHCGDEDSRQEVVGALVVAGGDSSKVLEAAEHSLDQIARPVGFGVVIVRMFPGWVWRDDGFCTARGEPIAEFAGVIGAVRQQATAGPADCQERARADQIVRIARRQDEGDRAACIVGQGVDFRRPSAARGANGVMMSPPFAPAAERCALMCVESMLPLTTTDCPVRAWKIASQTPWRLHRL